MLVLATLPLLAQVYPQKGYQPLPLGKDTICFRYRFAVGDTLFYHVTSLDSVKSSRATPLVKDRSERLMVWCDSVDKGRSIYRLHQRLISVKSVEWTSDTNRTTRTTSPWVGRTATLVIDSLGRRLAAFVDDSGHIALGPGGALQPWVIVDLGQSCGRVNESWLRNDSTLIPENGAPEPAYRYSSLFRVLGTIDTLGKKFDQVQYAQTGIGSLEVEATGARMEYVGTLNSYGKLSVDRTWHVLYHLFATAEIKYTITVGNGQKDEGKHLILMNYALDEIRSRDPRRRFKRHQP